MENPRPVLSRSYRGADLSLAGETRSLIPLALAVACGPFLIVMIPFLLVTLTGLAGPDVTLPLLYLGIFVSYTMLLPLMTGLALRTRERKREIADEMMAFFSSKIVKLYSLSEIPAIDEDLRTKEAYILYIQAELEIEGNPCAPLLAREKIERGVCLADSVLAKVGLSTGSKI